MIDYPCAKIDDFSFSRFDFIARTNRQTDRITDVDDRYTDATTVKDICSDIVSQGSWPRVVKAPQSPVPLVHYCFTLYI